MNAQSAPNVSVDSPYQERYYQTEALVASAAAFFDKRIVRQIIGIPTGTGKTVILAKLFAAYEAWLQRFAPRYRQMIVVAHREELLDQAADKILRANPTLAVDIEQASKRASDHADVVVASVQTLAASKGRRLQRFDPARVRVLAIDECHHAIAPTYRRVIEHFGLLPPAAKITWGTSAEALAKQRADLEAWNAVMPTDRLLLGLTATPTRGDRIGLEAVFQTIVYSKTMQEMIRERFLCRLRAIRVQSATSLDAVKVRGGDFDVRELSHVVNILARNKLASQAYREHALGRRAVVFCADVQHAHLMAETFTLDGVTAQAIDGGMPGETRRQMLADFRRQKFDVLCNCQLLTEGWDDPGVSCIIHARPTKSSLLYIQMTGRGTRIAPNKDDCLVIDVVDATKRHSLVTLPSIFGLPANFNFDGADVVDVLNVVEPIMDKYPSLLGLTLEDFQMQAETVDLFAVTDDVIDTYGTYGWCRVAGNYVLSVPIRPAGSMYLEISTEWGGKCQIELHIGYQTSSLASTNSVEAAFRWAEQWYQDRVPSSLRGLHRQTGQPELALVSPKQQTQLERFGVNVPSQTTWFTAETMLTLMKQKGVLPS